jgi:hypothetical protein
LKRTHFPQVNVRSRARGNRFPFPTIWRKADLPVLADILPRVSHIAHDPRLPLNLGRQIVFDALAIWRAQGLHWADVFLELGIDGAGVAEFFEAVIAMV